MHNRLIALRPARALVLILWATVVTACSDSGGATDSDATDVAEDASVDASDDTADVAADDTSIDPAGDTGADIAEDTAAGDIGADVADDTVDDGAGDIVGDTPADVVSDTPADVVSDTLGDAGADSAPDTAGDGPDADMLPSTASAIIGPEGGGLTVDGAELQIPPGALGESVVVDLERLPGAVPDPGLPMVPASDLFELRPHGLVFAEPATLTIGYQPDGDNAGYALIKRPPGGEWSEPDGEATVEADRVSAQITELSEGMVVGVRDGPPVDVPGHLFALLEPGYVVLEALVGGSSRFRVVGNEGPFVLERLADPGTQVRFSVADNSDGQICTIPLGSVLTAGGPGSVGVQCVDDPPRFDVFVSAFIGEAVPGTIRLRLEADLNVDLSLDLLPGGSVAAPFSRRLLPEMPFKVRLISESPDVTCNPALTEAVMPASGSTIVPIVCVHDVTPPHLVRVVPAAEETGLVPTATTWTWIFDDDLDWSPPDETEPVIGLQDLPGSPLDSIHPDARPQLFVDAMLGTPLRLSIANASYRYASTNRPRDTLVVALGWNRLPERTTLRWIINANTIRGANGMPFEGLLNGTVPPVADPYPLDAVDSNQSWCVSGDDGDEAIDECPQVLVGQDGDHSELPRAHTIVEPGPAGESVLRDTVTGLTWTVCPVGEDAPDCDEALGVTQGDAEAACGALDDHGDWAGWAGLRGWRLPTAHELGTLIDHDDPTPYVGAWSATHLDDKRVRVGSGGRLEAGGVSLSEPSIAYCVLEALPEPPPAGEHCVALRTPPDAFGFEVVNADSNDVLLASSTLPPRGGSESAEGVTATRSAVDAEDVLEICVADSVRTFSYWVRAGGLEYHPTTCTPYVRLPNIAYRADGPAGGACPRLTPIRIESECGDDTFDIAYDAVRAELASTPVARALRTVTVTSNRPGNPTAAVLFPDPAIGTDAYYGEFELLSASESAPPLTGTVLSDALTQAASEAQAALDELPDQADAQREVTVWIPASCSATHVVRVECHGIGVTERPDPSLLDGVEAATERPACKPDRERAFEETDDGVLDLVTGLEWQRCGLTYYGAVAEGCGPSQPTPEPGDYGYAGAVDYCEGLGEGWRLPSITELRTLFDASSEAPIDVPGLPIPSEPTQVPAASSTHAFPQVGGYLVQDLLSGAELVSVKNAYATVIRCVRGPTE